MRYIEQLLKDYTEKKLQMEIINFRIDAYRFALEHPEIRYNAFPVSSGLSSGSKSNVFYSIVENNAISEEQMRDRLNDAIKQEESKIFHIRFETEQLEKALSALTREEYYIIECKFFTKLKLSWPDIEKNYNNTFKSQLVQLETVRTLKYTYSKSLDKLESILGIMKTEKVSS